MDNSGGVSRRSLAGLGVMAVLPLLGGGCVSAPAPDGSEYWLRVVFQPARVFKVADLPREGTEAWFVSAMVEADHEAALSVEMVESRYISKGREVSVMRYGAESARSFVVASPPRAPDTPASVHRLLGLRLPCRERAVLAVDEVQLTILLRDEAGRLHEARGRFAVGVYTQATSLIFPFKGPGIVTQGGAANGGHRNRSGQFAVDAMALAPNYAVQTGEAFAVNTDLSGFGRELVAPAAGMVVRARGDRPDQPVPGESNEAFHVPEHRGSGDPGNHIVIDHGNGEFSMIAHLQAGSLKPAVGQTVAQGQPIGLLGNSGDSFAPHVHYQLQDGPDWLNANGLPCRFSNVDADAFVRGLFFSAR
jgi:hypothetical protein